MKTMLVTGGAGFIGSNLCEYLVNKGNKVICVDNFYTGNINNIKNLDSSLFTVIKQDITEPLKIEEDIDKLSVNYLLGQESEIHVKLTDIGKSLFHNHIY